MTLPEIQLRRGQLNDLLFRRQHPPDPDVLDVFCPEHALAVEVDGAAHDDPSQAVRDDRRDRWVAEQGIRVLRFRAADVLDDEARLDVLATVASTARSTTP